MDLLLSRVKFYDNRTNGQLYVGGNFFCFTLEDTVREVPNLPVEQWKIKNQTAIPVGRYKLVLENSPKFGPDTPTLKLVPGFSYIRIHSGNTEKDTEGCIILGYKLGANGVIVPGTTRTAVADLKAILKRTKEDVWITVANID